MKKSPTHLPASGLTPVAVAAAASTSSTANAAQPTKSRGRPRKSRPYQIEGRHGWWANPTLPGGARPLKKFDSEAEAAEWIAKVLAQTAKGLEPALGGPDRATVAQLLFKYAYRATILKGGAEAELTRINNYLAGGGLPSLRLVVDDEGRRKLEQVPVQAKVDNQRGWQQYIDTRRELRAETYALIHRIGGMTCGRLTTELLGELATTMEAEGLSESTVQKEIALLKAAFNTAIREWRWKGYDNPAVGIKLGKSESRFVRVSSEEEQRLVQALTRCDNPQMWPLVELAITTCMRKGSLLGMKWSQVSLETGEVNVWGKGFNVTLPLSPRAVELLRSLPRDGSDRVFSMSSNAVQLAWNHVRANAGLPLQFRDLRHVGATFYARAGFNAHQLQLVLGHKSTRMAEVYVNLVNSDVQEAMARAEAERGGSRRMPPSDVHAGTDIKAIMAQRRAQRLNGQPELPPNVVRFRKRVA
jgi:integrase